MLFIYEDPFIIIHYKKKRYICPLLDTDKERERDFNSNQDQNDKIIDSKSHQSDHHSSLLTNMELIRG